MLSIKWRVILALFLSNLLATATDAQNIYQKFISAYDSKNYQECVTNGVPLTAQVDHPDLWIQLAECHCGLKNYAEAVAILNRLTSSAVTIPIDTLKVFRDLVADKTFGPQLKATRPPAIPSAQKGHELADRLFIPEGIAYDVASERLLVGSLNKNKIIAISSKGEVRDFFQPGDEQWSFVGLKIYDDYVWACAFSEHGGNNGHSVLFQIDRKTGKLENDFRLKDGAHLFNDLVKTPDGNIYVTDSKSRFVYRLNKGSFVPVADSASFIYPNGIAYDEKGNRLYVAHWMGVSVIDLKTEKVTPLQSTNKVYLSAFDGLYWHDNTLIALQNLKYLSRVVRLTIDPANTVTAFKELHREGGTESFPTTGTFVKNKFYFISNAYVRNVQPDKSIKDADKVRNTEIKVIDVSR